MMLIGLWTSSSIFLVLLEAVIQVVQPHAYGATTQLLVTLFIFFFETKTS